MAKEVKVEVLKVLDEREVRGNKIRLQVISWNGRSPVLEKREYWTNDEGEEKTGKAKGLNIDDLHLIGDQYDDIEKLMDR